MIAYIDGDISLLTPTHVHLDINGLGYEVRISLNTFEQIKTFKTIKLYTHLQVKEDSHTLFGFADEQEKELFLLLISISGIGAATAQTVLSSLTVNEVYNAIKAENTATFNKVKGIGAKTAQRVILELKDKIEQIELPEQELFKNSVSSIQLEALSALQTLGFNKNAAEKAINKVLKSNPAIEKVEELIRLALKGM